MLQAEKAELRLKLFPTWTKPVNFNFKLNWRIFYIFHPRHQWVDNNCRQLGFFRFVKSTSWALEVFGNFFNNKKKNFLHFSSSYFAREWGGFLNRMGTVIGCQLDERKCKKKFFIISVSSKMKKYPKCTASTLVGAQFLLED